MLMHVRERYDILLKNIVYFLCIYAICIPLIKYITLPICVRIQGKLQIYGIP